MSKKVKIFAFVVLGIAVLIGAVSLFGGSSTDTPPATSDNPLSSSQLPAGVSPSAAPSSGGTVVPNDFSVLLSTVKSIVIDTSIFSDPIYRTLRDYPVDLGREDVGRPNPFAPVGVDVGTISGGQAPRVVQAAQVQTLQPSKVTPTTAEFGARITLPDTTTGTVTFEYGTTDLFGTTTTPLLVTKTDTYLFTITGLAPGTTYNVRAVFAQGSTTGVKGSTMVFATTAGR